MTDLKIPFSHEGTDYELNVVHSSVGNGLYNSHNSSLGCHIKLMSGMGTITMDTLKYKEKNGEWRNVAAIYDAWGNQVSGRYDSVVNRFRNNPEELKTLVYTKLVESLGTSYASYIFSDPVNMGSATKRGRSPFLSRLPGLYFGPAVFAEWLARHPEYGVVYSSPVYGNQLHMGMTDFSLVQVFIWILKHVEWTISPDLVHKNMKGPDDEEHSSLSLYNGYAERFKVTPEEAARRLQITYA